MERQYKVEMTITVDDADLKAGKTVDDLVLDSLEEVPFQVDTIKVSEKLISRGDIRNKAINDFKKAVKDALCE